MVSIDKDFVNGLVQLRFSKETFKCSS